MGKILLALALAVGAMTVAVAADVEAGHSAYVIRDGQPLYFSMLLGLPVLLTFVWIIRMERQEGRLRALCTRHPISTVLVVLLAFFVGWSIFAIYGAKLRDSTAKVVANNLTEPPPASTPATALSQPQPHQAVRLILRHKPVSPVAQGGSQSGTGNTQANVGGTVDMSGDGCQQKIIGGSNNTNNCAPPEANITAVSGTRLVGRDYQCAIIFTTDIALKSNIAFTTGFDTTVEKVEFDSSLGPVGVLQHIDTGTASKFQNNIVSFSVMIPTALPDHGWVKMTAHSKAPIKVLAWKRGYE